MDVTNGLLFLILVALIQLVLYAKKALNHFGIDKPISDPESNFPPVSTKLSFTKILVGLILVIGLLVVLTQYVDTVK
jgi:hypothetical protein